MGYNTILCPFCASTNIDVYCIDDGYANCGPKGKEVWAAECDDCAAGGPWKDTKEEAIEAWNNRIS